MSDKIIDNLPVVSQDRPLFTNAHCNRTVAIRLMELGWTTKQIAEHYDEVFYLTEDNKLGQKYDYIYADGVTKETDKRCTLPEGIEL